MVDFMLSPKGDILFTESNKLKSQTEISFFISKGKPLKIDFHIHEYPNNETKEGQVLVTFNLMDKKYDKHALLANDDVSLIQQIIIRVRTTLGELKHRDTIGSEIETVMHKHLNEQSTEKLLSSVIRNALVDLITDVDVIVEPVVKKGIGYKQYMKAYIFRGNNILTTYEMEW